MVTPNNPKNTSAATTPSNAVLTYAQRLAESSEFQDVDLNDPPRTTQPANPQTENAKPARTRSQVKAAQSTEKAPTFKSRVKASAKKLARAVRSTAPKKGFASLAQYTGLLDLQTKKSRGSSMGQTAMQYHAEKLHSKKQYTLGSVREKQINLLDSIKQYLSTENQGITHGENADKRHKEKNRRNAEKLYGILCQMHKNLKNESSLSSLRGVPSIEGTLETMIKKEMVALEEKFTGGSIHFDGIKQKSSKEIIASLRSDPRLENFAKQLFDTKNLVDRMKDKLSTVKESIKKPKLK